MVAYDSVSIMRSSIVSLRIFPIVIVGASFDAAAVANRWLLIVCIFKLNRRKEIYPE